jgi:AraC family transcriptional regulator
MDRQQLQSFSPVQGNQEMLIDMASGRLRPAVPTRPELASDPVAWPSVRLEMYGPGLYEQTPASPVNHLVVVPVEGGAEGEWSDGGPLRPYRIQPGQFSLFPAAVMFSGRARVHGRFFTVSITPQFFATHTDGLSAGGGNYELPALRAVQDPLCVAIADQIRHEVAAQQPNGRQYVETLAQALSVHLVRRYGRVRVERVRPGGLSPSQLRLATSYIQEHLGTELPLAAIAKAAGLSPFHFARRFKQATGLAPHQYVVRHRLERARQMLAGTPLTLADVALQSGFCDQSHFTAHFRRQFGITPRRFREQHRG